MSQLIPSSADPADWFRAGTISADALSIVVKEFTAGGITHVWRLIALLSSGGGSTTATPVTIKNPLTGLGLVPDGTGAVTLPNMDEVLLGAGPPVGVPPVGKEIYFDTSTGKYHLANGSAWTTGFGGNGALKARTTQSLVAGNNTIAHNFSLSAPFATVVSVRDSTTGLLVDHALVSETANAVTINVGNSTTSAQITLIA